MDRRHRRIPRDAVVAGRAPERQRVELRRHDHGAAGRQRGERRRHEAVHVEQRHHAQRHVVGRERVAARRRSAPRSRGWRATAARASAGRCCRWCAGSARRRRPPARVTGCRGSAHAAEADDARSRPSSTVRTRHADRRPRGAPRRRRRAAGAGPSRSCPRGRSGTRLPCTRD